MKAYTLDISKLDKDQIEALPKIIDLAKNGRMESVEIMRSNGASDFFDLSFIKHLEKVDAEQVLRLVDKINAIIPIDVNSIRTSEQNILFLEIMGDNYRQVHSSAEANSILNVRLKELEALL